MVINLQRDRYSVRERSGRTWRVQRLKPGDRKGAERYRCFLNGAEVTDRCFYVDSRRGIVRLYLHRDGSPYVDMDTREPATERA